MSFGSNTTGLPKTGDYYLGRGKVYLSLLDSITNLPLKWRNVGNSTAFKVSVKTAKVQHYSMQNALKIADDEVPTQQDVTLTMTLDEISAENLAQFFSGVVAAYTNPAIAGFTNAALVANANIQAGSWYDVVDATNNRAYDLASADAVFSVAAPGTVATLVANTDYILDTAMGRIQLLASGITKLNTGGAGVLKLVLAAAAGASPATRMKGLSTSPVRCAVKLVPLNAKSPTDRAEFQAHSVMLVGNGDLSMIEDKYSEMAFDGLCGANTLVDATSPYFTTTSLSAPRS